MKRHVISSRHRARGMSLIEVLTTVLIFSIGLIALVGLQSRAVQVSVNAEDTNRAALFASELASEMMLQRTATLSSAAITAWTARVQNTAEGGLPNATVSVEAAGTNTADIQISWQQPSSQTMNRYRTQVVIE
jgi:type IV pilus assembly protein PilV